uniref:DHC_N2 domain-containing protein n=2 Tax=Panagrellus redivivus TaxID=6233 RepID=A0A7E4VJQ8_PANRE
MLCDCGIGSFPTANPECFKCAANKSTLVPNIDDETISSKLELVPKLHTFTVIVIGNPNAVKSTFLNSIGVVQHGDVATNNATFAAFHGLDSSCIDYSTCIIRYISKDELGIEEFDIHGIIILIENNTLELSNTSDNQIRDTFSRFPRRAVKNCCIVNMFKPIETFGMDAAQQQMREFVTTFRNQHALTDSPSFICVDAKANIETSKFDIEKFIEIVQTVQPVTQDDLRVRIKWKRLCDTFRPHYKDRDPDALRLIATVAANTLTGLAIYCRVNKGDALPLCDDNWPNAVSYWSLKDEQVATALQQLQLRNEVNIISPDSDTVIIE